MNRLIDTGNPQQNRTLPLDLDEAAEEAAKSPDTHWTAQLSTAGMTRIARSVVLGLDVADEDPTAGFLYEICWDGAK